MQEEFKAYRFEDLEVWKIGMKIVHEIYKLTKRFPKNETFALSDQLQRVGTSIVLNIAEGSGQPTKKAFIQYIQRSKSSVLECVACIKIALQEGFLSEGDVVEINFEFKKEYFKLIGLAKSLKN